MTSNRISVIGLGYIGLPTAAVLALNGHKVQGVDTNQTLVNNLNNNNLKIIETELNQLVQQAINTGNLTAKTTPSAADTHIIAVPTPFMQSGDNKHKPDLSYIQAAAKSIAPTLQSGNLVILESTSPVGTTQKLADWLQKYRPDLSFANPTNNNADISIAYCPERVLTGNVMQELTSNDRIIGGLNAKSNTLATALYKTFISGKCYTTNAQTAELAKLAENSFRDVNIAFANELSVIADKLDIDIWQLIKLTNHHPRVNILNPGPGVGGHCIAVDPWFIVDSCPQDAKLIKQARLTNDAKPDHIIAKVKQAAAQLKQPVIACLGLAFKTDIDDLRQSPALQITAELAHLNLGKILAVEPNISTLPPKLTKKNITLTDLKTALNKANIIVVLVDHKQFKQADKSALQTKILIDTRGVF